MNLSTEVQQAILDKFPDASFVYSRSAGTIIHVVESTPVPKCCQTAWITWYPAHPCYYTYFLCRRCERWLTRAGVRWPKD